MLTAQRLRRVSLLLFLLGAAAVPVLMRVAAPPAPTQRPHLLRVSMIELIANPAQYDGKRVHFVGYARIEFEDHGIYVRKEDYQLFVPENRLAVLGPNVQQSYGPENGKYVLVEATFHATYNADGGSWERSIDNVTRFEPLGQSGTTVKQRRAKRMRKKE